MGLTFALLLGSWCPRGSAEPAKQLVGQLLPLHLLASEWSHGRLYLVHLYAQTHMHTTMHANTHTNSKLTAVNVPESPPPVMPTCKEGVSESV